uniref:Uncharacterized protein n=1 Tax=Erpetoichthys calabaricus TaxID=27687 RepID=A0A8C4SPZ7_ERPCA
MAAAEVVRPEPVRPPPPPMLGLTEDDNIESYLSIFERTATRNQWPRAEWASILAPYLKRPAPQVVEQVACEGLIYAMPDYLAQQVRRHPFKDMNSLLEVLERQLAVTQVGGCDGSSRGSRQGRAAVH